MVAFIAWIHGPFPCGTHGDRTVFNRLVLTVKRLLLQGEKIWADGGCRGDPTVLHRFLLDLLTVSEFKREIARDRASHETINGGWSALRFSLTWSKQTPPHLLCCCHPHAKRDAPWVHTIPMLLSKWLCSSLKNHKQLQNNAADVQFRCIGIIGLYSLDHRHLQIDHIVMLHCNMKISKKYFQW